MPKSTYYNLPEEKQRRIFEAAAAEIKRVPVNEVSINRIIQNAGISRGSFYQYFEDKNDLEAYILGDFVEELRQGIRLCIREEDGDLFTAANRILHTMADLSRDEALRHTMMHLVVEAGAKKCLFDNAMALQDDLTEILAEGTAADRLCVHGPEEIRQLARMLFLLLKEAAGICLYQPERTDEALREFEAAVALLQNTMERRDVHVEI